MDRDVTVAVAVAGIVAVAVAVAGALALTMTTSLLPIVRHCQRRCPFVLVVICFCGSHECQMVLRVERHERMKININ